MTEEWKREEGKKRNGREMRKINHRWPKKRSYFVGNFNKEMGKTISS